MMKLVFVALILIVSGLAFEVEQAKKMNCHECADKFVNALKPKGKTCCLMMDNKDVSMYIPKGCQNCAMMAHHHCEELLVKSPKTCNKKAMEIEEYSFVRLIARAFGLN